MSRLPTLTAKEASKALQRGGFKVRGQHGSHQFLVHPETGKLTTVPMHPGDLRRALMKEIIRQAGLSEDEFRTLL